jgi:hypothetical protein
MANYETGLIGKEEQNRRRQLVGLAIRPIGNNRAACSA